MIDWLADTLLATSLLMALVLLVREPVRRQFGPTAAYGLWLVPVLRLLMPPLTETVERTVPAAPLAPLHSVGAVPAAGPGPIDWGSIALWVWLIGAVLMLIGGLALYRWQRRQVLRDAVQVARLGTIRIVRSAAVRGPMAFGIFDRVIALPIDFDDRYAPEERRLALDHELAHHRSGDLVVSHFAFALLCLQWFNPLAWLSHAAFRFDQEAACDARVLDKVSGGNRAAYAHAITKAASGRALLFAGALDRPHTLQRRLASMLTRPTTSRRFAGKALVALTAAAALPLTASRATEYVDVPAPSAAAAPAATPAAANPAVAAAPAARDMTVQPNSDGSVTLAGGVTLDKGSTAFFGDDRILMNGKVMRVEDMTPAERTRLRAMIARSKQDLARERAELPDRLAEARRELERVRSGEFKRDYQRDLEDLRRDLAEVELRAAEIRADGDDPAKRKAELLRDLQEAQAIDIDKEIAEALRDSDPATITAELRSAEQQMERLLARLDALERN